MRSSYECQTVVMIEGLTDILSERVSRSTRADTPTAAVVRIGPEQITHRAFVRHLLNTVDGANVIQGIDGRREASVQTEDLSAKKSAIRYAVHL